MILLGIGDLVTSGSSLVVDGKVRAAVSDERILREEMLFGVPRRSMRRVLELQGLEPGDVDAVAVGMIDQHLVDQYRSFRDGWFRQGRAPFKQILFEAGSRLARWRDTIPGLERGYYLVRQPAFAHRRRRMRKIIKEELGIDAPVVFVDHHYAHASAAYYSSPFGPEATVLTVDGGGDQASAKVFTGTDGELAEIARVPAFDSVGNLYACASEVIGLRAGRDGDKLEALSALGEPIHREVFDSLLTYEEGRFRNVGGVFFRSTLSRLEQLLPDDFNRADVAASVQSHVEDLVARFARSWILRTGNPDVALAGGIFRNGRIARRVRELPEVQRCYVFPAPSDRGIGIGAALALEYRRQPPDDPCRESLDDAYLGPSFSDDEIRRVLADAALFPRETGKVRLESRVAELLARGNMVARFAGRMECGPRSLGHRSVLCPATDPSARESLNEALGRPSFLEVTPIVLAEEASRCFRGIDHHVEGARYATMSFECTDWLRRTCPGACSPDGSARPYAVRSEDDPELHTLLRKYRRRTGLPVLLSTDFGEEGEPLVCSPDDAVQTFLRVGIPHLAIGSFLVRNPAAPHAARRTWSDRRSTGETAPLP